MKYSLPPFTSSQPTGLDDLRATLRTRRTRQRDLRLASADLRLRAERDVLFAGTGSEQWTATGAASALAPNARTLSDLEARLTTWLAAHESVLVRIEENRVRAILPGAARMIDNLDLLDAVVPMLQAAHHDIRIEHCDEDDGELHLTAYAPALASEVVVGDYLYGGFFLSNSETSLAATEACVRIFRVACSNGALMDASEGQRMVVERMPVAGRDDLFTDWRARLDGVVQRSFDGGIVDDETRRLRSKLDQILATPYEFLLNLIAQGIISEAERDRIQREFNEGHDESMYGLINAVTSQAHGLRGAGDWRRAFDLERLGGEIARGDHEPPVMEPVRV